MAFATFSASWTSLVAPVTAVEIAWELGVERAKNAVGYSWYGRPLIAASKSDPVDALLLRLALPVSGLALAAAAKVAEEHALPPDHDAKVAANAAHGHGADAGKKSDRK